MRKLFMNGVNILLGIYLLGGMAACKDKDPDYDDVTPPEVKAIHDIAGVVTAINGSVISGATITAVREDETLTVQTNSEGMFYFDDVLPGVYKMTAMASGRLTKEEEIVITDSQEAQKIIWNARLASEGIKLSIRQEEATSETLVTETIEGNENAAIEVTVTIPPAAAEADDQIIVTPVYSLDNAGEPTRAQKDVLIAGTMIQSAKGNPKPSKAIEMVYTLDKEVVSIVYGKKYSGGAWVDIEVVRDGDKVIVSADEFTTYALFISVDITITNSNVSISFTTDVFDNLYGTKNMQVDNVAYTYKLGGGIQLQDNSLLSCYLLEILAQKINASKADEVTGTYPVNITLPVGTKLTVKGTQATTTVKISFKNKSVSGTLYGNVSIVPTTSNRQHTGGSVQP